MFENEIALLKEKDPVLAEIIDRVGHCTLELEEDSFRALAEAILYQQLSLKAASAIVGRFVEIYHNRSFPKPIDILETEDERLRKAGISRQKIRYLKDLSCKFMDGIVTPPKFSDMTNDEIVEQLMKVKGIGRWTAEMFLIFSLGRVNVLPVDDLGFQKAIQKWYGFENLPSEVQIRIIAKKWEPYCTVATWYLWKSL
ncbi:DNA-3-methyladenine glycosylase 2 family protein [candidate division WOR-3 bacterium]|nr:DNA-3-methyladenine glycosylase 2 family protein [candidate division WOR-3 bacterium]